MNVGRTGRSTSGTVVERRPPNTNASIGTPSGRSQSGSIDGHCEDATVKREFESVHGPLPGPSH